MRRSERLLLPLVGAFTFVTAAHGATHDLTGLWDYASDELTVIGPCPPTGDFSGRAEIVQTGDAFTLDFVSGQACVPEAVCHLEGAVSDSAYHAENSVVVDQSGGIAATTLDLDASSATAASGSAVTTYTLGDLACVWTYDFAITYAPEPGGAGLTALLALGALCCGRSPRRAARRPPRSRLRPPRAR